MILSNMLSYDTISGFSGCAMRNTLAWQIALSLSGIMTHRRHVLGLSKSRPDSRMPYHLHTVK